MEITARYFSGVSFLFAEGGARAVIAKRDTKAIGDMSELEAARALARAGYLVSKPLGDSHRYDLIIDDGTVLSRVQVKTGRLRKGAIIFACFSSHSHRGGPSCRPYRGEIEFFAVYCPETDKVYLLPESDACLSKAHLRVAPPRNSQRKIVRWASQYELL
jgi:PD-(D/E)XK endonuclease